MVSVTLYTIFLVNITSVDQPKRRVSIAIAPFGAIVARAQHSALAFPRSGQAAAPIIHFLVLPRHPPRKRLELLFLGRRIEQSRLLASVLNVLSARARPVNQKNNNHDVTTNFRNLTDWSERQFDRRWPRNGYPWRNFPVPGIRPPKWCPHCCGVESWTLYRQLRIDRWQERAIKDRYRLRQSK